MSAADPAAWHGRAIRFGADEAISGADTCAHPAYKEIEAPVDSFLRVQYHIRGADLGLETLPDRRLWVTEVSCAGLPWDALGGVVLWTARDRRYAIRDGVFLELRPAATDVRRKD